MQDDSHAEVRALGRRILAIHEDLKRMICPKCHTDGLYYETQMGHVVICCGYPIGKDEFCNYSLITHRTLAQDLPAPKFSEKTRRRIIARTEVR